MVKKTTVKKNTTVKTDTQKVVATKSDKQSLTGDHYTLRQVAVECINFQTENEMLQAKKGSIADHFMNAATMYITEKPNGEPMAKDHPFLVACKMEEEFAKSKDAGVNQWDKIPPNWSQMKSNIKAAYNMGLDITSYKDEFSMRKDLNEARKVKKGEVVEAVDQVDTALQDAVEQANPEISLRLFAIVNQCKKLTEAQNDEVVRILDQSLEAIITMKEIAAEFEHEEAATA